MKYAIDRMKIGHEEEVSASSFYNTYIPQKSTRFFCPECGEQVFWRSRGGAHPDMFCHYARTSSSPECDKRVDGRSELNLYERVGLPMCIVNIGGSDFRINIMFPAVGEKLLDAAARENSQICIPCNGKDRIFPINYTYFQADATTMIPIDFVPPNGRNYTIQINAGNEIKRKWSNYSDGFAQQGAIFTYKETEGKKIRRGDSISPGRLYYVVAKDFSSPYSEIDVKKVGTVRLNESNYSVYVISINVSADNEQRYQTINNYLKSQFGVWMIETTPELIALWPPVTEQEVFVPIKDTSVVYCSVLSGNTLPKVYSYRSNNVTSLTINHDSNGINTLMLPINKQETAISVDRKYVGREVIFQKKQLADTGCTYEIALKKRDGSIFDFNSLTPDTLLSDFFLNTNAKMELYIGSREQTYLRVQIRNSNTPIPVIKNIAAIFLAVENGLLQGYYIKPIRETFINENDMLYQINANIRGGFVPVPRWVIFKLTEWQRNGYIELVSAVKKSIRNGLIPYGLLNVLQNTVKRDL